MSSRSEREKGKRSATSQPSSSSADGSPTPATKKQRLAEGQGGSAVNEDGNREGDDNDDGIEEGSSEEEDERSEEDSEGQEQSSEEEYDGSAKGKRHTYLQIAHVDTELTHIIDYRNFLIVYIINIHNVKRL